MDVRLHGQPCGKVADRFAVESEQGVGALGQGWQQEHRPSSPLESARSAGSSNLVPCDFAAAFLERVALNLESRIPTSRSQHQPLPSFFSSPFFSSPPICPIEPHTLRQKPLQKPISLYSVAYRLSYLESLPGIHATYPATMTQIEEHDETLSQAGDESMTGPGAPTPLQSLEVSLQR